MAVIQGGTPGASWQIQAPRVFISPDAFNAELKADLGRLVKNTAARFKSGAQRAYAAYPRIAAGFQQITTVREPAYVAGITNVNPIFPFREYDTKPHVIAARIAPRLAFMWQGHLVRPVSVNHPGTTGLGAIGPLYDRETEAFAAALDIIMAARLADG